MLVVVKQALWDVSQFVDIEHHQGIRRLPWRLWGNRLMLCELSGEAAINRPKLKPFAVAGNHGSVALQSIPKL